MRFIATLAVSTVVAAAASADTVRLQFDSAGSGRNVRVSLGNESFNCFAGQLIHNFTNGNGSAAPLNGTHITFCSDLMQSVTSSGSTYTVTGIQNLPGSGGMGAGRMQAIYDMYSAAGGAQMGSDADMAAAFQLAIWEVIYDYDGANMGTLNLASGSFKARNTLGLALSSAITTRAATLFSAIGSNAAQTGLIGLSNGNYQDQIVQLVPVPTAALAGLAGLGIVGYVRRRAKR